MPSTHSPAPKAQRPEPVGIIGLGIMGSAMAASLMKAGYQVIGYDVAPVRVRQHVRAGGVAARNAAEVARRAPIVICSLPSSAALLAVAADIATMGGSEDPPLRPLGRGPLARRPLVRGPLVRRGGPSGPPDTPETVRRGGGIVIETSTLPIATKERARAQLAAAGVTLLDCPLSGTGAQARVKDLVVYASGPRAACRRVAPILNAFSRADYYVGPFGAGSKTKFVANLLVAIHNVAAAEGLVLAMKAGLDPALTLKVIADGAGNSRMLQVRGPMMVRGDYADATMKLDVWQKDMTVIADFAKEMGCPTPLFAATAPIYIAALAMGRAAEDTGAVCAVLEELANHRRAR